MHHSSLQYPGDDLHVPVRMGVEAGALPDDVLVVAVVGAVQVLGLAADPNECLPRTDWPEPSTALWTAMHRAGARM